LRFRRQLLDHLVQLAGPFWGEDIALGGKAEIVLGQRSMNAVLQGDPDLAQRHAGPGQLSPITNFTRGDPDRGQRAIPQ